MLELKHITYTVSTPEGEQTILNDKAQEGRGARRGGPAGGGGGGGGRAGWKVAG